MTIKITYYWILIIFKTIKKIKKFNNNASNKMKQCKLNINTLIIYKDLIRRTYEWKS